MKPQKKAKSTLLHFEPPKNAKETRGPIAAPYVVQKYKNKMLFVVNKRYYTAFINRLFSGQGVRHI
jgi:hypothetical protein